MKFSFKPALKLLAVLALAAGLAPLCLGQQRNSTQRELQRTLERELLFREMEEMAARGPAPRPTRQPPLTQINEDFERIQIINHTLALAVASGEELDFKLVGQAASEIKKRAGRLKENLLLPEPAEERHKTSSGVEPGQLKAALAELDRLVFNFVHNPGFQSIRVVDAEWSVRARSDLEEIIELSGRVKKSSERLHRAAGKSH
jgi:hypothetical protein